MIRDVNMMQRLLWKDAMTIKPMVIAIVIGIIVLNLAFLVASGWLNGSDPETFIALWILMPNLVALGAPALLVGSEEESGTLGWLRTLPLRWQQIADSKFIVSLAAVVATWIIASIIVAVVLSVTSLRSTPISDELAGMPGVLQLSFFSLLLLLCGFVTAYLFRSPVTALITLVPLIVVANTMAIEIGRWILSGFWKFGGTTHGAGPWRWLAVVALAVVVLLVLWLAQRFLARRRLTSPQGISLNALLSPTTEAYRPPARVGLNSPSQLWALLWQQARQVGWAGIALTIVVAVFVLLNRFVDINTYRYRTSLQVLTAFAPLVIGLGGSWLGVLAFYGDNVRRRCDFFADRGVSPTLIWLTRLFLPSLLCLGLVLLQLGLVATARMSDDRMSVAVMTCVFIVMFAFGQLVAQWMPRATLTFLGAPTYAFVSCVPLVILFGFYPGYYAAAVLIVPVLLLASWRMTGRWLQGRIDAGFHGRIVAYTMLGILLPCLAVFGQRYVSTPAYMPQWRAEMLAMQLPDSEGVEVHEVSPDAYRHNISIDRDLDMESIRDHIKQELANDGMIAQFVSQVDLQDVLDAAGSDQEIRHDAIAIYLKWASIIREETAAGLHDLDYLNVAEYVEQLAVDELTSMTAREDPRIAELVAMIPNQELRRESRKAALINEWRRYQQTPWEEDISGRVTYYKLFANQPLAQMNAGLSLERRRSDRFIDEATRLTLQQLEGKLPARNSTEYRRRQQLWDEAVGTWHHLYGAAPWIAGYPLTSDYQQKIDLLRVRYPAATTVDPNEPAE